MSGLLSFSEIQMEALLEEPVTGVHTAALAEPEILRIAKEYNSTLYPGFAGAAGRKAYNPAPGHAGWDGAGGVYYIDGEFVNTLELEIVGDHLQFRSSATRSRRGSTFAYGQAIIDGGGNYEQPYRLLPAEFYGS